jgi:spermidine/putrescine transport system substrate-binding protein
MTQGKQRRIVDPSFIRGATMPRLSKRMTRRDLFRYGGVGAGALSLSAVMAACGVKSESSTTGAGGASTEGTPEWWAEKEKADLSGTNVNFTNWPAYIDHHKDESTGEYVYPTLDSFTQETGIEVTYRADINDNTQFYAAIRPDLEGGNDTGHDIIVITNGSELTEMIELGYLIPLDQNLMTNFYANADPTIKDPAYDPGNVHTMAWQSGFTGIAYNKNYVDKEITSFMDLFDEAYAGKIGMIGNNADLPGMALLAVGVEPTESTPDDWQKAADLLQQQKDSGVVRKYYVQDYLEAFENEDVWISMAWSGDILIDKLYYGRDEFEFIIQDEGGMIWTDNMCIPAHAANPVGALKLMNHYYDPKIAALLTEYNNYVGPVPDAKAIVEADAKKATGADKAVLEAVANSPLVFPTPEIADKVHRYRVLSPEEEQTWNELFVPIYQG